MKKSIIAISYVIAVVASACVMQGSASAWHPNGQITKSVKNDSNNSSYADKVAAKPGDTLRYQIEVRNDAPAADNHYNDMVGTVMTDTLPAGVELFGNESVRDIKVTIGTLKPGEKVTKEYIVKVTAKQNGTIVNKACFTGDTEVNDNPQSGCDTATVTVTVPTPTPLPNPTPTPTPVTPMPVSKTVTVLPKTGSSSPIVAVAFVVAAGYTLRLKSLRKRSV